MTGGGSGKRWPLHACGRGTREACVRGAVLGGMVVRGLQELTERGWYVVGVAAKNGYSGSQQAFRHMTVDFRLGGKCYVPNQKQDSLAV